MGRVTDIHQGRDGEGGARQPLAPPLRLREHPACSPDPGRGEAPAPCSQEPGRSVHRLEIHKLAAVSPHAEAETERWSARRGVGAPPGRGGRTVNPAPRARDPKRGLSSAPSTARIMRAESHLFPSRGLHSACVRVHVVSTSFVHTHSQKHTVTLCRDYESRKHGLPIICS